MAQSNWSCSSTAREAFEPGARWVRARDQAGRVLVLPSQVPGLVEEYGLSRAQTDSALRAIDATGRSVCGAAAVNRVLQSLGTGWSLLAQAYRIAPVRWAEDSIYRWVADHRSALSFWTTTLECQTARC